MVLALSRLNGNLALGSLKGCARRREIIRLLYNQEIYDRIQATGYGFDLKTELTQESWRIKVKEVYYYQYGTENLFEKHKTYLWIDIGMFPKNERTIGCVSIDKTKELIKQRWWLK